MVQRATNTYQEWLSKTLQQVQSGKMVEDAIPHLDFITNLETAILGELHQPVDAVTGQGASQVPNPGPPQPGGDMAMAAGAGPGGPPMGGPPGPPPGPSPMGGAMPGVSGPNPDELRRILAQSGPA